MHCGHSPERNLMHSPSFLQCSSLSYITRLEVRPLLRTCLVACLVACMFRGVGQVIGRDVLRSLHQYVHPFVNLLIGTCCPHACNLQLEYLRQGIGSIRAETPVYPLKETTRECRKASPSEFPGLGACCKKMVCSYVVRKPYFTLKTYL